MLKREREAEVHENLADKEEEEEEDNPSRKGSKQKPVYGMLFKLYFECRYYLSISGVINEKWYQQKKIKPEVATLIGQANQELDFVKREEVYKKFRAEMIVQFRCSKSVLFIVL